jgi:dUTP pyrophosphatase
MKIMLDEGAKVPTRAHSYDAGLDIYTPVDVVVPAAQTLLIYDPLGYGYPRTKTNVCSVTIDTGVHVEIPEGCCGFVKSKSGLNVKHGLTADGVIDSHYTGSICVKLYNHTDTDYHFKAGDKIAQLVILPCVLLPLEEVDILEDTDRGENGFGSTGR